MKKLLRTLILLGAPALVLSAASQAGAVVGTLAGTSITNTATVGYSLGGIAQTPVPSNAATFVVDRKVNVTVAPINGATLTSYTAASQVTTFTVTNTTNSTQDFQLVAANDLLTVTTALSHTDNFSATNLRVYVDTKGTGIYDPAVDTTTFIDELAPDATKTVFIVADIPATGPALGISGVVLTAVAAAGGATGSMGAVLTPNLLADNPLVVDTVFADGAGWADIARDGKFSADSEYDIAGAAATVVKTATLISDPLDGILLPKSIPGAVVEYCIQVKNISASTITGVSITDVVPTNTTYLPASIFTGGTVLLSVCNPDGTAVSDGTGLSGSTITTTAASIPAGVTTTMRFRVTLN